MNILFIHGRSQQGKDPVKLQQTWEDALNTGISNLQQQLPLNVTFSFPYYGDELAKLVSQLDAPLMPEIVSRGGGVSDDELAFRFEVFSEMAAGAGISDDEIASEYGLQPIDRGPLNWKWVHAILRALDKTSLSASAIDRFTRDVYVYLTVPAVRRTIDKIVAQSLTSDCRLVIGHSLGTIVGYNVLNSLKATTTITKYITLGSPLGIRAIRERLDTPLKMPPVKSWFNAYDTRDVVSLYPLDVHNFNITPPIENHAGVANTFSDDRHSIEGYLADFKVSENVYDSLT